MEVSDDVILQYGNPTYWVRIVAESPVMINESTVVLNNAQLMPPSRWLVVQLAIFWFACIHIYI